MQKNKIILELDKQLNENLNKKSKELKITKKVIIIIALEKFLDDIEELGVEL